MKAVLISIQPKWCELIASGKKTVEVRKTRPKIDTPFKVYIYETKDKNFENIGIHWADGKDFVHNIGKVIGEFVCKKIHRMDKRGIPNNFDYCYLSLNEWGNDDIEIEITDIKKSCISKKELNLYGEKSNCLYAWHISGLVIYDEPKDLNEFKHWKKFDWWDYGHHTNKPQWEWRSIERPPQSWCYVERSDNNAE